MYICYVKIPVTAQLQAKYTEPLHTCIKTTLGTNEMWSFYTGGFNTQVQKF